MKKEGWVGSGRVGLGLTSDFLSAIADRVGSGQRFAGVGAVQEKWPCEQLCIIQSEITVHVETNGVALWKTASKCVVLEIGPCCTGVETKLEGFYCGEWAEHIWPIEIQNIWQNMMNGTLAIAWHHFRCTDNDSNDITSAERANSKPQRRSVEPLVWLERYTTSLFTIYVYYYNSCYWACFDFISKNRKLTWIRDGVWSHPIPFPLQSRLLKVKMLNNFHHTI